MKILFFQNFIFGIWMVACNDSQFSSKEPSTNQTENETPAWGKKDENSGQADQSLNTLGESPFAGPAPSLAKDRIDKTIWFGCCPSYMQASKDLLKKADRSKPNWAAKAYSKIERFSFERVDFSEYKLEKTMYGYFDDPYCKIPLSEAQITEYRLKPLPKNTNVSSGVKLSEIASDGSKANGLHTIRDTRAGSIALIDQKVSYTISGSSLTETITLDSKSFIDYEGYQIQCILAPLSQNNSP